jgi:hypothetical protein
MLIFMNKTGLKGRNEEVVPLISRPRPLGVRIDKRCL